MKKILLLSAFISLYCHAQNNEVTEKDSVYSITEQPAQFPGGMKQLFSYIDSAIIYPKDAREANLEGKVYVKFIVGRDGRVSKAKVIKTLSPTCDAEALRVINSMPKWIPAKQSGENVPVYYTLPVPFKIKPQPATVTQPATPAAAPAPATKNKKGPEKKK